MVVAGGVGVGSWDLGTGSSAFSGSQLCSSATALWESGKSLFFSGPPSPHPQDGNNKTQLWGLLSDPRGQ